MNIAVINVKDLFKYILKFFVLVAIIILLANSIKGITNIKESVKIKEKIEENRLNRLNENSFLECLDLSISLMSYKNNNNENKKILTNDRIIAMGSTIIDEKLLKNVDLNIENKEEKVKVKEPIQEKQKIIEEIPKEVTMENVTENNIVPKVTNSYNSVKIDNQSDYDITEEMLIPDAEIDNKKDILIYHTHTCESYTPSEGYEYEMTGNYRTTDLDYSVARVGEELTNYLKDKGFNVEHNTTYHDYPAYSGSYSRALETVQELLLDKNTDIVIDLHRDAVGSSNTYGPTVKINEMYAAQLMFVIGTDGGGLDHPKWNQNLKIAIMIQQKANEMYPGLFRPIIIRNSRYNQHVAKGACIIEVGATGNTLDECILSMQCLANVLEEVCK